MAKEIVDMMIKEVSAVDKAATKKKFLLIKKDTEDEFKKRTLEEVLDNQEAHQEFMKAIDAFYNAIHSTMRDSDMDTSEKANEIQVSSTQLVEKLNSLAPDLAKRMDVESMAKNAQERLSDEGGDTMPELKDILEKIEDEKVKADIETLVKSLQEEESTEVEIDKSEMPEALRKRFEDLEKKAEMAETLAKAEREKRLEIEFNKKAKEYSELADVEKIASILRKASDTDEELAKSIEEVFSSVKERLANTDLFKEKGDGGETITDAEESIEKKTKELMKSDTSLTFAKAQARVLRENPDLYSEYVNQK